MHSPLTSTIFRLAILLLSSVALAVRIKDISAPIAGNLTLTGLPKTTGTSVPSYNLTTSTSIVVQSAPNSTTTAVITKSVSSSSTSSSSSSASVSATTIPDSAARGVMDNMPGGEMVYRVVLLCVAGAYMVGL